MKLWIVFLLLLTSLSCSKTKQPEKVSVQFNIPRPYKEAVPEITDPTTISDVNCVGLFISSSIFPNGNTCTLANTNSLSFLEIGGLSYVTGSSTSITVNDLTIGDNMTAYLVGFETTEATNCPNFQIAGFGSFSPGGLNVSHGHLLDTQSFTVDPQSGVSFNLIGTNSILSSNKLEDCDFINEGDADFGSGLDGSLSITNSASLQTETFTGGRIISPSRRVDSISNAGFTIGISSAPATDFIVGDNVLVHVVGEKVSGDCQANDIAPGKFLDTTITGIGATSITLEDSFTSDFTSIVNQSVFNVATNTANWCFIQVVRIGNFENLTVDSTAISVNINNTSFNYNPTTVGGIIALKVTNTLTLTGANPISIGSEHSGHRGGGAGVDEAGSGVRGPLSASANAVANGGGGGNSAYGAGGGGSSVASGGAGTDSTPANGGLAIPSSISYCSSNDCLTFGGGGGSSGAGGAAGGGIVILRPIIL